jgi:hypothetical protein
VESEQSDRSPIGQVGECKVLLPGSLEDFLNTIITAPSQMSPLFTYSKQRLIHQIWQLLLVEEFLHAYQHKIVLCCVNGIV